jgi:hypothetical protein
MSGGYVKPVYQTQDPETGEVTKGYSQSDYAKIREGYACGLCGEDYKGRQHAICPVCKQAPVFVDEPERWIDNVIWTPPSTPYEKS